jgi:outer membrane lipoprotein LolB
LNRRSAWLAGCSAGFLLMAGCATPPRPANPAPGPAPAAWSGRLSLRVDSDPVQSFSALFELRGAPQAGELILTSPIGNTLARLHWSAGEAILMNGRESRRFDSLDALIEAATGAVIPVDALFAWLAGREQPVPGWRPDLTQIASGRISAIRETPQPRADLRIVFEPA